MTDYSLIEYFNYSELEQNYDPIYDTLVSGAPVWIKCNCNNISDSLEHLGDDRYLHFMVTLWYMTCDGLVIVCPDGSRLCFPNGSHNIAMSAPE